MYTNTSRLGQIDHGRAVPEYSEWGSRNWPKQPRIGYLDIGITDPHDMASFSRNKGQSVTDIRLLAWSFVSGLPFHG